MKRKVSRAMEVLNEKLIALEPDVIAEDRKLFLDSYLMSASTLHRYLNGAGGDYGVAVAAVKFFSERIENRNKEVGQLLKVKI